MEHIFYKIIMNIYFDHIHIICLYRVFSVHCTGYMLVYIKGKGKDKLGYNILRFAFLLSRSLGD
jgi:hypothetical protein